MSKMSRRKFLGLGALALPAALGADAGLVEPTFLRVTEVKVNARGSMRIAHFSDLHYKGDEKYGARVIAQINRLAPDFACFTGDLVEDAKFAPGALDFIRQIKAPVYGAPGNHDYWCHAPFSEYESAFAATGGEWLVDRAVTVPERDLEIVGLAADSWRKVGEPKAARRLLLMHYPAQADTFGEQHFDLILAGHSHGGQVRLPLYGPLILPWGVGRYDHGYFDSPAGPMYVNAGIGTYYLPFRFNCRPEITLLTL